MAMLQMLAEVICSEKLFRLVALAELVNVVEMLGTNVPARWIGEFLPTISASVGVVGGGGRVKRGLWAGQRSTRPRV